MSEELVRNLIATSDMIVNGYAWNDHKQIMI